MKFEQKQFNKIQNILDNCWDTDSKWGNEDPYGGYIDTLEATKALVNAGYGDVSEYKAEIERLKNANSGLTDNLVFYKDKSYKLEKNVDKLKTEIEQEVKQAQIDVLNEIKKKTHNYYPSIDSYCISQHVVLVRDIDELIKELKNEAV